MIEFVSGEVTAIGKDFVIVNVGGVGLRIQVAKSVLDIATPGEMTMIYTHFVVREDAMLLFGFASTDERSVFETLITVNGVGPKMGISVLSSLSIDQLRNAVASENPIILTRVPGVGKKTAEKIVFELKGKMQGEMIPGLTIMTDSDQDVLTALTATFGYSVAEAQSAVQSISRDAPKDVESRLRLSLQYFGN